MTLQEGALDTPVLLDGDRASVQLGACGDRNGRAADNECREDLHNRLRQVPDLIDVNVFDCRGALRFARNPTPNTSVAPSFPVGSPFNIWLARVIRRIVETHHSAGHGQTSVGIAIVVAAGVSER